MRDHEFYRSDETARQGPMSKYEESVIFFLILLAAGLIGIAVSLYIPKVEHFSYDPATGNVYQQWTYGSVGVVRPESITTSE